MKTVKYLLVILLALIAVRFGFAWMSRPIPDPHLTQAQSHFDQETAFAFLEELVTTFPERNVYHPDRKAAALWLQEQLASFGLEVFTQDFSVWVKDELIEGQENVYAVSPGKQTPEEIILVVAHFDIPPFVYQGALDNGSGVAAALELARIFAEEEHNRTLVFLMSDSEEYGAMWGALHFMKSFENMEQVKAVLVLDMVNTGEMKTIRALPIGLQRGFTPLWLRELSLAAIAREVPVPTGIINPEAAADFPPVMDWIVRSVAINPTESGVFLRDGFPAVHLSGVPKDQAFQDSIYHTQMDTIDHMQVESIGNYGRAVERTMRSIDEQPQIPEESMYYLKLRNNNYLPAWAITFIQLLLFAPLFYAAAAGWRQISRDGLDIAAALKGEFLRWFTFFGAGLAGTLVLKLLPNIGWMVRYELYPATQKDPVLYNPQYLPLLITVVTILVVGFILWKTLYRRGAPPAADWQASRTVILTGLALLVTVTFAVGAGFGAVSFLLIPAYLWPLVGPGNGWGRRLANLLLICTGFTIYAAFIYGFSQIFEIGVMWWYLFMSASYGLFSWRALLAVLAGLSLYLVGISLGWRAAPDRKLQTKSSIKA